MPTQATAPLPAPGADPRGDAGERRQGWSCWGLSGWGRQGWREKGEEAPSALSPSALTEHQTPPHGAQDSTRAISASLSHQVPLAGSPWRLRETSVHSLGCLHVRRSHIAPSSLACSQVLTCGAHVSELRLRARPQEMAVLGALTRPLQPLPLLPHRWGQPRTRHGGRVWSGPWRSPSPCPRGFLYPLSCRKPPRLQDFRCLAVLGRGHFGKVVG